MFYRKQYFRSFTTWLRLSGLTDASFSFFFFLFPHCRFSSEHPPDWTESLHSVSLNTIYFILLNILNIPSCFQSDPVSVPRYLFFFCLLFLFFFSRLDFTKGVFGAICTGSFISCTCATLRNDSDWKGTEIRLEWKRWIIRSSDIIWRRSWH